MGSVLARYRSLGLPGRLGVGAGVVLAAAGVAALGLLLFGRPQVSVSSGQVLVRVKVSGAGARLSGVRATSDGRPVALVRSGGGLVPAAELAQGQLVRVTATATPPSWLHWLLGSGVSATETVRTPAAPALAALALASTPGTVPVSFATPVSVVEYRSSEWATRVVHLARPSTVAHLPVPSGDRAGFLKVTAAPLAWEQVTPTWRTVSWFVAPSGEGPLALASPTPGSATVPSDGRIRLTFDQPVAKVLGRARPSLRPPTAGAWSEPEPNTLVFTPSGFGFGPGTAVTVSFPRPVSVLADTTTTAAGRWATTSGAQITYRFSTRPGSVLRLEEILAQLHYLPLSFTPAAGVAEPTTFTGEVATISQPLKGSFSWRWASTPASLRAEWSVGSANVMLKGALMAFESNQGSYDGYRLDEETVAEIADDATWKALLEAAASGTVDPNPYSYVYVTQGLPEILTLWENGSVVLSSPTNTGIPEAPTVPGTYPIYLRFTFNYMSGFNPDGSYYDDPVYWINYFNGGNAVHGFVRASYGSPQSLGCVELPVATAATAFSHLAIGDLVDVAS